jgi:hypothetical protein
MPDAAFACLNGSELHGNCNYASLKRKVRSQKDPTKWQGLFSQSTIAHFRWIQIPFRKSVVEPTNRSATRSKISLRSTVRN